MHFFAKKNIRIPTDGCPEWRELARMPLEQIDAELSGDFFSL
jgi:hypothetical protein